MELIIDDKKYSIIIEYKNIKNMYLRVKDDMCIHITCSKYVSDYSIKNFVSANSNSIKKMIDLIGEKNHRLNNKILYLGKGYDIYYIDTKKLIFGDSKVFVSRNFNLDKWYKEQANVIFKDHFDKIYNSFRENIPYPCLKIRNMTSKWGVCNVTQKTVTLNLNLIKLDTKYLDYVIVHELSHLLEANHSSNFWKIVSFYVPNYKVLRKEMKNIL